MNCSKAQLQVINVLKQYVLRLHSHTPLINYIESNPYAFSHSKSEVVEVKIDYKNLNYCAKVLQVTFTAYPVRA